MKARSQRWAVAGLLSVAVFFALQDAHAAATATRLAYIDPGAGSFLLQALIAAFAGIVVTLGVYWQKIKSLLGLGRKNSSSDDSEDD